MKKFTKALMIVLSLMMIFSVAMGVACNGGGTPPATNTYKVTFMVEGQQYGETISVQKGRRITNIPQDPTFSNASYVFTGWYTSEEFAEESKWNFATKIVMEDTTLYAGYRAISDYVSELRKAEESCTSKLVWTQSSIENSAFEVVLINEKGSNLIQGTVSFDPATYTATFTPNEIPQGGRYNVSVKDTTKTADPAVLENVLFGGAGTESNPYLIGDELDFAKVNKADVAEDTYFKLANNITIATSRADQKDFTFNGILDGDGRTITLNNSNSGAIYKVGPKGHVFNIGVAGAVATALYDSVGSIVDFNQGKVEKIRVTATVESTGGLVGSQGLANALDTTLPDGEGKRGIAGGVVGTNLEGGQVYNCTITTSSSSTGVVKSAIAGGTIVGLNYGVIEMCVSNGCVGAWNSTESGGKSLSKYSYSGGIAGINAGQILKCSVSGSAKLLAQRYEDGVAGDAAAGQTNSNFGGIVGYNMSNGSVTQSYFAGIRVHADENVGGIAGINAGNISDCYVKGVYSDTTKILSYIGGRKNVGGIVGLTEGNGTVKNCFVTANVYAFTAGTAYQVAVNAENSVYLSDNVNEKSVAGNPEYVALTEPTGNGNQKVTVEKNSYDGQTKNFKLEESYLATLNGNNMFAVVDGEIVLVCESEKPAELTIEVELYKEDGSQWKVITVAETGESIDGPAKLGHLFVGWATKAGGEVVFGAGVTVSLYDVRDYKDSEGKIKLYPVYEKRAENQGLIVGVWVAYVEGDKAGREGLAEEIKNNYLAHMQQNGLDYEVEFRLYNQSAVADFGAAVNADGDVDVLIGSGTNIGTTGGVAIITRSAMNNVADLTSRQAALLTDTVRALDFYSFVTGIENGQADVIFNVNGVSEQAQTVNGLLGVKATAPSVTVEEGKEFKGWATTENATEAQISATEIAYADVKDFVVDGKVTLYAVVVDKVVNPDGPEQPEPVNKLKISVWAKGGDWVKEEQLATIKDGFNALLVANGYKLEELNIEYVVTNTSGVADLGKEVNDAGDFDFIIGCGKNVESTGKVTCVKKAEMIGTTASSRYCAMINENELTTLLYDYLVQNTLKVSVWSKDGSWVSEKELEAIKTALVANLTALGYNVEKLTIEYVVTNTSGVADLGAEVNTAGDFDLIIGCGKNVESTGKVTCVDKATMTFKDATDVEIDVTNRYAALLDQDNVFAKVCYDFLIKA